MQLEKRVDQQQLAKILGDEGIRRMKMPIDSWQATLLRRFGSRVMPRFTNWLSDIDLDIGRKGLRAASADSLQRIHQTTTAINANNVPQNGPVLIVANHPGAADFVNLLAVLPRDDQRVVAGTDMLDMLPYGREHFVYTSSARRRKFGETTQLLIDQLRLGRCVVLFPRGMIEPDPRWMPGARATLAHWRRSMEHLANAVPELVTVPTAIGGSVSRKALMYWGVRLYNNQMLRGRGAAILQTGSSLVNPAQWPVDVTVRFGRGLQGNQHIFERVSAEMNHLYTLLRDPTWPLTNKVTGWI